jgi:hypothetical protein
MGFALEPWRDEFPGWDMNYFWVDRLAFRRGRKDCTGLLVRFVWSSGVPQHDGGVAASMEQLIRAGLWPKD